MFVPCPHCGFLVALIVRPDGAPQRCPRCDGLVQDEATAPVDEVGTTGTTSADAVVPDEAVLIEEASSIEVAAVDAAPTVAVETNEDPTHSFESAQAATQSPASPTYEDAIAAATVGATSARRTKRAARPRRKGAPSFARHTVQHATTRTHWGWYAGIAALALLFALQLLLAQRHELAADPRWRPLVSGACGVLRCEVPAWREPAAFTMLQRTVRPQPGSAGVLAVEASFRNDARWHSLGRHWC